MNDDQFKEICEKLEKIGKDAQFAARFLKCCFIVVGVLANLWMMFR